MKKTKFDLQKTKKINAAQSKKCEGEIQILREKVQQILEIMNNKVSY